MYTVEYLLCVPLHMTVSSQEGMSSHVWLVFTLSTYVSIHVHLAIFMLVIAPLAHVWFHMAVTHGGSIGTCRLHDSVPDKR
jgi:hypothetical protein